MLITLAIFFFSAKAKKVTQELAHWCLTHEDIEMQIYFTGNKRWKGFHWGESKNKKKERKWIHIYIHTVSTTHTTTESVPLHHYFHFNSHFYGYYSIYLVKHFRFELFLFLACESGMMFQSLCGSRSLLFPHWSQHEISIWQKEEKYHVSCLHIQLIPTYS